MSTTDHLLPCPCCGEPVVHTSHATEPERVDCICGISMEAITWPVLLSKWNSRATKPTPPPPDEGDREAVAKAMANALTESGGEGLSDAQMADAAISALRERGRLCPVEVTQEMVGAALASWFKQFNLSRSMGDYSATHWADMRHALTAALEAARKGET